MTNKALDLLLEDFMDSGEDYCKRCAYHKECNAKLEQMDDEAYKNWQPNFEVCKKGIVEYYEQKAKQETKVPF